MNTTADTFYTGEISNTYTREIGIHFQRGLNIQPIKPIGKRTAPICKKVLLNLNHNSNI